MKLRLRYFASLREALGEGETLEWMPSTAAQTVGALREWLLTRSPMHAKVLVSGRGVRSAVDQVMACDATLLREDAEVAFFPPVTGG